MVLALLALVVMVDQAAKWWAWRHVSWTRINSGGDVLVGRTIGAWYAGPVTGALLDLLDFGLLSVAVWVLARHRATAAAGVPGALMTAGWGSNLADRLGMHYWTAPGSVRGVVDFIHIGGHYYNVADFFIIGCTPLFLLAAGYQGMHAARRPVPAGSIQPPARSRLRARARILALAGASLMLVVGLGAANYGGVNAAPRTPARGTTDIYARWWPHHFRPGSRYPEPSDAQAFQHTQSDYYPWSMGANSRLCKRRVVPSGNMGFSFTSQDSYSAR
jgi:lipoprotein signal peptidase